MSFVSTIIIPELEHPNFLAVCLMGLIKNSVHKHKIIIVWSEPKRIRPDEGIGSDFIVNPDTGKRYQKYHNVREFLNIKADFLIENQITDIDVTEDIVEFFEKYKRGEIFPDKINVQGGVDIAFKNNVGIHHASTQWVIPNWDDDFYPSPAWDDNLFYVANKYQNNRAVFIPAHVQPFRFDVTPEVHDVWSQFKDIACNRLTIPIHRNYVTDEEWTEFCLKWTEWKVDIEPCGLRSNLHYLPILYRREYLEELGPYCYQGSGYEVEYDNRLAEHRFLKMSPRSSFILHKGYIAVRPEDI